MSSLSLARIFPRFPALPRPGLAALLALHRQRQRLARLDDAALEDIGLTRDAALAEARRPLWDAPGHWSHAER
ncbi:DUF1127 domain-containing protein [Lacimonas salitolerans]|uniref:DUF1127 domain-containing protein n=1 Tax=Lacimonas salitolerans TaxID=1323750 RepID=A0ABW4EL88_9RHOB